MKTHKNKDLETIRGLAASLVVLGHLIGAIPDEVLPKNHATSLFSNWGTEAVMIFFVLSGIVIHASFDKRPRSNREFLSDRIIRIHPILLISVFLAVIVERVIFGEFPAVSIVFANIIPVTTLQGVIFPVLYKSIPVVWSLTFEIFFYTVLGFIIIRRKKINAKLIIAWLLIGLASLPFFFENFSSNTVVLYMVIMLSFSPIWLVGFYVWQLRDRMTVGLVNAIFSIACLPLISRLHLFDSFYDPVKYLLFALTSAPAFMYALNVNRAEKINTRLALSQLAIYIFAGALIYLDNSYSPIVKLAYASLPLVSLLVYFNPVALFIKGFYQKLIRPPFAMLGGISYSLYLVHYPLITLFFGLPEIPVGLSLLLSVLTALALGVLLEKWLQNKINKFAKKRY